MATAVFARQLQQYGPHQLPARAASLDEAHAYCRRLASSHYENFTVVSWLLPRELRPHFYAVYAWCRWADDLADETRDGAASRQLLEWWHQGLMDCYRGRAEHPVYVALADTVQQFEIPTEPFEDLLTAFRQDQSVARYETLDELLGYCRLSANPVGRLILYLGRCHDPQTVELADSICTGLQLANFWQDVAEDYDRGRIYLPHSHCQQAGYDAEMFARREYSRAFRKLLGEEVERAEEYLLAGRPLVGLVPRQLRLEVALFIQGGLGILQRIRALDYNVWRARPRLGAWDRTKILAAALRQAYRASGARRAA